MNQTPITGADLMQVLRASGWLTRGQAYDLAEILITLLGDYDVPKAIAAAQQAAENT